MSLIEQLVGADEPWRRDALCQEYPDVDFFPERGDDPRPAKRVCMRCLVRVECALYAAQRRGPGVWGGMTERERRRANSGRARQVRLATCCAIAGCERPARARGLCAACYERQRRGASVAM